MNVFRGKMRNRDIFFQTDNNVFKYICVEFLINKK